MCVCVTEQYVIAVACGPRHTAAVLADGAVCCWGDSSAGQCGTGQLAKFTTPQLVTIVESPSSCCHGIPCQEMAVVIRNVACSETHTMVLSDVGEIWTWGTGMQLGLNTAEQILTPKKIEFLEGRRVLTISCGEQHSLALIQRLKKSSRQSTDSLRGNSKSRSQSPVVNDVQMHRYRPSTCVKCKEDIYTYTETNDTCIIHKHKCPLGLSIGDKNGTAICGAAKIGNGNEECGAEAAVASLEEQEKVSSDRAEGKEKTLGNKGAEKKCKSEPRQSLSVDICESDKDSASARSLPRSCSAMARLEQTPPEVKTEVLRRNLRSETDVKKMELEKPAEQKVAEEENTVPNKKFSDIELIEKEKGEVESESQEKETTIDGDVETVESLVSLLSNPSLSKADSGISKSRSTCFIDETEAKEFLEKQLYGDDEFLGQLEDGASSTIPMSPLVKEVRNILQYVPSSPAQVQQYVTTLTKNVVTNLRTSFEERFAFVAQSMDSDSISKSSSQDSLGHPGSRTPMEGSPSRHRRSEGQAENGLYGSMTRSSSLGSFLRASASCERKGSLPAILMRKGECTFSLYLV